MKCFYLFLILSMAFVLMQSCSTSSGPEAVAKKAIAAIQKGDYDTYAATFDLSSSNQKKLAGMAEDKIQKEIADKGGIKSYKITNSSINGDDARVTVHIMYKDASEEDQVMDFTKVDGEWKQEMKK